VERRKATGAVQGATFQDSHLDRARAALAALVQSHAGTLLEDKGRTVAIHFRLAPQFEAELREQVAAIAAALGSDYHVQSGSMMLEIKPRGFNKGHAVRAFLQEPPFSGRTPVYIGDDLTDIDGFKVVEEYGGVSIAVGERVHGQYHLENPRAVFSWLEGIAGLVDQHR
jgi:trehalose 6-phosphate phosphatase